MSGVVWMVLYRWFSLCLFKQKTAYEVRISDWSADVCSSDLLFLGQRQQLFHAVGGIGVMLQFDQRQRGAMAGRQSTAIGLPGRRRGETVFRILAHRVIGRASCRERVCPYV